MRIAIMGAGGVGGYFGGLLAQSGEDVTFIARGEHFKAMAAGGLQIESVNGSFHLENVQVTDDPTTVGQVDLVIVATKTYHLAKATEAIRPLVGEKTTILPVQNGVDASELIIDMYGAGPVLGGTSHVISLIAEPGVIQQKSEMRWITLGELDGPISDRVQRIADTLARASVQVEATDNINKARWSKFVFIAAFGGVGAAARVPVGAMRVSAETRQTLRGAMEEVKTLAAAKNIVLDADIVDKSMTLFDRQAPDATASMQRDIMEGRLSELEAHSGYIARMGADLSVPVPVHTFLYSILLPQELRARQT